MKAVYFSTTGGSSVLKYGNFPTPTPKKGEALIRVHACGLNHLDLWLRKSNGLAHPMPHIPGSDVSGVIEKINGKTLFKIGDGVVVNPGIPCGKCTLCKKGKDCEKVIILGAKTQGGYAEYVTVPLPQLYPKPKKMSFVQAAAFPLAFLTAWHMLATRAQLQKGETVFIWGASGGLGSAGIQIAKHLGAKVIAAAGSSQKARKIKKLGADHVVIYTQKNVIKKVMQLTNGKGVNVVLESVGNKTWKDTLSMLGFHGRIVIAGTTGGETTTQDISEVYVKQQSILGCRMGYPHEFRKVLRAVTQGKLSPTIDSVYPLRNAKKAHDRLEKGNFVGKIVLQIP